MRRLFQGLRRVRGSALGVLVAWVAMSVAAVAAAVHDVPSGAGRDVATGSGAAARTPRPGVGRLPVVPGETLPPLGPAVLETIDPWQQPSLNVVDWQIAFARLPGTDLRVSYRVPQSWQVDARGRAVGGNATINSSAIMTNIRSGDLSLAAYAAQLAEGSPIYSMYHEGYPIYLTSRRVSIAPTEPDAGAFMYHTAVVEVDDHVAKLEVRYPAELDWRYHDLGRAVIGTIDISPRR